MFLTCLHEGHPNKGDGDGGNSKHSQGGGLQYVEAGIGNWKSCDVRPISFEDWV